MKRIFVSLSIIAAVAAIVIGGTIAYFSDTESSIGNTFTAGTLNLQLDKDGKWYDGQNVLMFEEGDVKPGDSGEETLSFHVDGNDAWLCKYLRVSSDKDNGCNEPEDLVDDTCGVPGVGEGELDEKMDLLVWEDNGDNIYQEGEGEGESERIIFKGKASNLPGLLEAKETLAASTVAYIGIEWSVDSGVGNIIQSDSLVVDGCFYAEQTKNNSTFVCPTTWPCQ
jgi:predicted ribosomally synthesized peptide with SipW-like signal peptide